MLPAVVCQLLLLAYHQCTTVIDLYPFNGVRNHSGRERWVEAGVNAILMSLPPIGYFFGIRGLMIFGTVYYFALFFIEIVIWWIPYFTVPTGVWRAIYNRFLVLATSNFEKGDTLDNWTAIHRRLHSGTISPLPPNRGPIVPNLEHILLHVWTLVTALATAVTFSSWTD
jgi:hypothetical protein